MNPYNYENGPSEVKLSLKKDTPILSRYEIQFRSALDTGYPENNTVYGEYYCPKVEHKIPLLILVHGMGDHSVIPCKLLARSLVKHEIACFVPYLTIHSRRIPQAMRKNMPYLTPDEWFHSYQVSVTDIRQIVDWAHSRPELDTNNIAVLGISFGGFVSAIAMGIDARIKGSVLIVTSGNSNKMSWLSRASQYRERYQRTEAEHLEILESYARYLKDVSENGLENVTPEDRSFLTDPLTYSSYLRGRPVLMINALWDKYIPKETVIEFWHACGRPDIKWIPSGHSTIWLWYPAIRQRIKAFFESSLAISV